MDRDIQQYLAYTGGNASPRVNYEQYFRAPQKPVSKGSPLLKTLLSIGGGTLGAIGGTFLAPGAGTAAGGALGSGLGTALGRALGGQSVLGEGGTGEIALDALLGGAFSGFGKAAKAAKLGGTALGVGGKELAAQTAKGLGEGAGVATGKKLAQPAIGDILEGATKAAKSQAPQNVLQKLATGGKRMAQKEIGLAEGVKYQGRVLQPSQLEDLSNFIKKDLGVSISASTKPGMILRNNETYAKTLRPPLDNILNASDKVFNKVDANDIVNVAKKKFLPGTNVNKQEIASLISDTKKAITKGSPASLNQFKNSLDDIINYNAINVTPEKQRVASALRQAIDGKITQAVPDSKTILNQLTKSNKITEIIGASGRKEAGEVGSFVQRLERTARTTGARIGGAEPFQRIVGGAGEKLAQPLTLRSALTRQAVGQGLGEVLTSQPQQPVETGMEAGLGTDMTDMGAGTMEDTGQQAQIDSYFQGLAMQDLQQTGGKRLSAIKAAYDLFGGGKAEKKSISQQNAERKLNQANKVLGTLESQLTAAGGPQGLAGALPAGLASLPVVGGTLQPKVRAFQDLRQGAVAQLSKALGESGVLTDQDIQRALNLVPTVTDSPEQAAIKFRALRNFLSTADTSSVGTDTRFNF